MFWSVKNQPTIYIKKKRENNIARTSKDGSIFSKLPFIREAQRHKPKQFKILNIKNFNNF
jgi:hypothetical protein